MNLDNLTLGDLKQIAGLVKCEQVEKAAASGRAVVVVDRGWIFAGDCSRTDDGYLRLERAVHVFGWKSIGFAKMLVEWNSSNVDVRQCAAVEIPEGSLIFRVPVDSKWGLK